jgi:hypothetical protein
MILSVLESKDCPMPTTAETERLDALDLLDATHRAMADRAEPPRLHHLATGLLVGMTAAVQDTPLAWGRLYLLVAVVGLFLLARSYREQTGLWLGSFRVGRTRWVTLTWALGVVAMFAAARWAAMDGLAGAYQIAGTLIALATAAAGYAWHWAYCRDLGVL